ncbi:hypothetical protein CDAR_588731 [Caerostris darwini]|uniref:Uncharacterized protein n=1 Tax=Caerostris darwini TaxID=1538125 RepID=A0AAV4UUB3_9ARAC|nr:hypothetical protein CDAR_588731 [Caerostris darwini]
MILKDADASLNKILFQIEYGLAQKTGVQLKLAEVLPCADELKQEFEQIKNEVEVLVQTQEEIKNKIGKELDIVCKKLMDLQRKSRYESEQSRATATLVKIRMATLEAR